MACCGLTLSNGIFIAGWYVAPKVFGYLTTRPQLAEQPPTTFQVVQIKLANGKEYIQGITGMNFWIGVIGILRDNGWVAAIAYSLFLPFIAYPAAQACILDKILFVITQGGLFYCLACLAQFFRFMCMITLNCYDPLWGTYLFPNPWAN